jgi:hypothetical protein
MGISTFSGLFGSGGGVEEQDTTVKTATSQNDAQALRIDYSTIVTVISVRCRGLSLASRG